MTQPDVLVTKREGDVVEIRVEGTRSRRFDVITTSYETLLDALLEEQTPEQERSRQAAARTRLVAACLGGTRAAARALRVAPSQVSRWSSGEARPAPDQARRLLDLDHVIAQAQLLWATDELVRDWLTSHNSHLGARPIDVVDRHGSGPVVDAIRAELAGGYA